MKRTIRSGVTAISLCLTLTLAGCQDTVLRTRILNLTTLAATENVLHVHPHGDDANLGTRESPKRTINAAIATFVSEGISGEVHVAGGTYEVNYSQGTHVVIAEGVSLHGGFAPDFSERDPLAYETVVHDTSLLAPEGEFTRALESAPDVTHDTVVQGISFVGADTERSAGAWIQFASPVFGQCDFRAGEPNGDGGTGGEGVGIGLEDSGSELWECTIAGSQSATASLSRGLLASACEGLTLHMCSIDAGLSADNATGLLLADGTTGWIGHNTITGTTAAELTGIVQRESNATLDGNTISVGGEHCANIAGIALESSSPNVGENTVICGEAANASTALWADKDSNPFIFANTFIAGKGITSHGIFFASADDGWIGIRRNRISSGSATYSSAIRVKDARGSIEGNVILAGMSAGQDAKGIEVITSNILVHSNTIVLGETTSWTTGLSLDNATADVVSNLFMTIAPTGPRCAISGSEVSSAAIRNNAFYDDVGAVMRVYEENGDAYWTVEDLENHLVAATDNVAVNPLLADLDGPDDNLDTLLDNDWRVTSDSPSSVVTGGEATDDEEAIDFDGTRRTDPWSIGAYEYDPAP